MRDHNNFFLPSKSSISGWLNVTNLKTGLCEDVVKKLKLKSATMSEQERQTVLMFDEMSIKKSLDYNQKSDMIEGYEDLGNLKRSPKIGTHVMQFLIRGLMNKWKLPIAYYVANNNVKGEDLASIVKYVIKELLSIHFKVRAVVCDQGTNNQKAINILGANRDNPFFAVGDNKVYIVYDVPHLIKSVRNTLMKSPIEFQHGVATWDHIVSLYDIDNTGVGKAKSLMKITERHLRPNTFEKMKVKYATQVFSNCVKAAMRTAVDTSQLPVSALETAQFIEHVNDFLTV